MYADVIVDISHENLDKAYQYRVRPEQEKMCDIGALVRIPFGRGNRMIKGYVVGLCEEPKWEEDKIKELDSVVENGVAIESQLIHLAGWIRRNYGSTMNDALRTVLPVKQAVKNKEKKYLCLKAGKEEAKELLTVSRKKNNKGRVRLLEALLINGTLEFQTVLQSLKVARSTVGDLEKLGILEIKTEVVYRNPISVSDQEKIKISLNEEQQRAALAIRQDYLAGRRETYLLHGITGSGKTEVYMEAIDMVLQEGKQVIMLIPEIALTFQTVMRFYRRFGNRISILNSRLSKGERYDQYIRAKKGEIDIIIGPRSALFTPFGNLGLIIMDEEHEGSYKSENQPRYHAREVALERARMAGASVILGSATPSVESYKKAEDGEYKLLTLEKRAGAGTLPKVHLVDLRQELKEKNRSIFSRQLRELMEDRLSRGEQAMLFINRRGYSGFVSCRSCGHVLKCPHCDISLTFHKTGKLVCHYCGYEELMPKLCPACGSPYIASFGTGTQKIEELVKKEFPGARVLRMDADTTGGKEGHEKVLSAFAEHKADILVGTQMIVKGHDFKDVTLVGALAADLSLYSGDYRAAERTFDLLVQASGRAGRGSRPGQVVIQTYTPEHYSIRTAAAGDYKEFYRQEILYRKLLSYPPKAHLMAVLIFARREEEAAFCAGLLRRAVSEEWIKNESIKVIGPASASISKINDIYRQVMYIKSKDRNALVAVKDFLEGFSQHAERMKSVSVQFDFDPMSSY